MSGAHRLMLFTVDDCDQCAEMKDMVRRGGLSDEVIIIDAESDEVQPIIDRFISQGIEFYDIPQCAIEENDGELSLCDTERMWEDIRDGLFKPGEGYRPPPQRPEDGDR